MGCVTFSGLMRGSILKCRPQRSKHRFPSVILEIPDHPFLGYIFDCDGTLVDSMPLH